MRFYKLTITFDQDNLMYLRGLQTKQSTQRYSKANVVGAAITGPIGTSIIPNTSAITPTSAYTADSLNKTSSYNGSNTSTGNKGDALVIDGSVLNAPDIEFEVESFSSFSDASPSMVTVYNLPPNWLAFTGSKDIFRDAVLTLEAGMRKSNFTRRGKTYDEVHKTILRSKITSFQSYFDGTVVCASFICGGPLAELDIASQVENATRNTQLGILIKPGENKGEALAKQIQNTTGIETTNYSNETLQQRTPMVYFPKDMSSKSKKSNKNFLGTVAKVASKLGIQLTYDAKQDKLKLIPSTNTAVTNDEYTKAPANSSEALEQLQATYLSASFKANTGAEVVLTTKSIVSPSDVAWELGLEDLVTQPEWVDVATVTIRVVMSGKYAIGNQVVIPPGIAYKYSGGLNSPDMVGALRGRSLSLIQGQFRIINIIHKGRWRGTSNTDWCTILTCIRLES